MPQLGVEYSLEPTEEQQKIYRQMIDLGADIILAVIHMSLNQQKSSKRRREKFILYSMGNLLSNQRYETVNNYWTERGSFQKSNSQKKVIVHFE